MAAGAVTIFSFVAVLFVIAKVIGLFFKTRVSEDEELLGLDVAIHGESAYDFGPIGGSVRGDLRARRRREVKRGWMHEAHHRGHQAVQAR